MKKTLVVKLMMIGCVAGLVVLPTFCFANELSDKIVSLTAIVVNIGFALVTLMVVFAGILFVTSAGDPGKVTTAKACLLWAVIGAIILAVAYTISNVVLGL